MSEVRSMVLALVLAALASIVFVGAVTTSEAGFAASTENRANLWEAAEVSLEVDSTTSDARQLFLDGDNLYPGREITNCVVVSTESSLDAIEVRLHGTVSADATLAQYLDVLIERSDSSGCAGLVPGEVIYQGTLAELIARHGSFAEGLLLSTEPGRPFDLAFSGSVKDTNDAQGLGLDYLVFVEARP